MAAVKLTGPVESTQAMLGLHDKKGVKPDHEDVVIISIDLEFRALGGGFPVLEVGVATFDTRDVYALDPTTHDDFAYIKHITAKHFRFIESGHIQNTARWLAACYNNPDGFLYGHTEWISRDQLEFVLLSLLRISDTRNPGTFRKVQMITHGGRTDLKLVGSFAKPPFDLEANITMTIEELQSTSKYAMTSIWDACNGQQPAIEKILRRAGLEQLGLHNAGNDAVAQLAADVKIALKEYRERPEHSAEDTEDEECDVESQLDEEQGGDNEEQVTFQAGLYDVLADLEEHEEDQEVTAGEVIDYYDVDYYHEYDPPPEDFEPTGTLLSRLSQHLKAQQPQVIIGTLSHCTRCGSDEHPIDQCNTPTRFIECKRCLKRGQHITLHCPSNRGKGANDEFLEARRRSNYDYYWKVDHRRGVSHRPYVPLAATNLTEADNIFDGEGSRAAVKKFEAQLAFQKSMRDTKAFPALTPAPAPVFVSRTSSPTSSTSTSTSRGNSPTSESSGSNASQQTVVSVESSASMWAKVKIQNHKPF